MTPAGRTAWKAAAVALVAAGALAAVDSQLDRPDETRPHMPTVEQLAPAEDSPGWNCYTQGNGACQKGARHQ